MDTSQHDESADTDSSRPADPRSGKTTPERSPENQQQRQSSDEEDERLASDVLLGAKRIAEHLAAILGVPMTKTTSITPTAWRSCRSANTARS